MRRYYVYILTNATATVFYVGMTNDLKRRILEHRQGLADGFTKQYSVYRLVYFEAYQNVKEAIAREKQLKRWRRDWKLALVRQNNPEFRDWAARLL